MALSPRAQTLIRLMGVQAAWTYERMAGIGVGHAAAPLLRSHFREAPPEERRAAVARSAEYFNSHPYLAGVAVGAVVRAERERESGIAISRLRTALSGPLGAMGDQLIWAGEVPALMGLALAAAPWIGWWTVPLVLIGHNLWRLWLTRWGLDLGLSEGIAVGAALRGSWLPRGASDAQRAGAFGVGLGVPVAAAWLLADAPQRGVALTLGAAAIGIILMLWRLTRSRVTGARFGLVLLVVALLIMAGGR
jgi:mannose/fructose/N-acetylgalactosamine-specific phosphotransferase system component IID